MFGIASRSKKQCAAFASWLKGAESRKKCADASIMKSRVKHADVPDCVRSAAPAVLVNWESKSKLEDRREKADADRSGRRGFAANRR
jgi:hypothetical protein